MLKKEIIWREILWQALEKKQKQFTQKELAAKFGFSLSTVFNALKIPRQSGAVEIKGRYFRLRDGEKFLNIWATFRHLTKDIIYQTQVKAGVNEIEGLLPPNTILTAYSAYRKIFQDTPADYDKVYVYSNNLLEIKKRFPPKKGCENLIILQPDKFLPDYGLICPLPQLYVDLWNLLEWYAKYFLEDLRKKIFLE